MKPLKYSIIMWLIISVQLTIAIYSNNWFTWSMFGFNIGMWLAGFLNMILNGY